MTRKVLIVDDLSINRRILKGILASEYEVLEARSGEEALDILRRDPDGISAVLLDISMPGMDGFEVLNRVRSEKPLSHMPVIMITGSEDKETRVKSLALGANDFVMKPYGSEIIKHCLHNNIAFREASATVFAMQNDRLTGVWTREAFFHKAAEKIEKAPAGYYVLGCVDIDNFKVINDQYGSEIGDKVLISLADAMRSSCEKNGGICGHIFADCFISLYPRGIESRGGVGPRFLQAHIYEQTGIELTLSVGRYVVDDKSLKVSAMYDRATIARRYVKGRYDTHVAVYDESMRKRIVREQSIVNDMRQALTDKQFEVWYQPQYNHSTDAMIGAEALVRWRHPQNGLIPPNDFIPVFEQNGFIYALDKFVWEEVCRRLRKWIDAGRSPLPVSVNISRYDITRPDIISTITALTEKYGLPRDLLRLEITETMFSESSHHMVDVVKELVDIGYTVEIDDFGSGYSSLHTLKDVPAQIIKLDMKFLKSSTESERGGNIMESIVRMAKWLGMSVIAEGVETLAQADYLRSIGCGYIQGYLYARPMPVEKYEEHCGGSEKEERLLALETVENLDNNAFWDPGSMDTLIFNSYVGGACILEYHGGNIEPLRATKKYAQILGGADMTIEDALRLDWAKHMDAETFSRVTRGIDEAIATKKEVTGEYVYLDLPNSPRETYLRTTMRVIASAGERYLVYCTNENITAQRKAEELEKKTAEQLQGMMNDMPGGFVRMSVAMDGTIKPVYMNDGFAKLLGMTRDEVMRVYSNNALAGAHPDDLALITGTAGDILKTGVARNTRFRLKHKNGEYIWLSVFGRATKDAAGNTFLNIYYSDATEQVKQEEVQKKLLDNLPCGAGVYEFKDGQMSLTYQNKSYWDLVGLHNEAFPDPSPMSAVHPDDIPVIMQDLALAVQQNRDVSCYIRLRHLSVGFRTVHLVGRIVHNDKGGFSIYATFTPADS